MEKPKINVKGNAVNGTIKLNLILKDPANGQSSVANKIIPIHKRVGDSILLDPSKYESYPSISKPIKIHLTPDVAPNGAINTYRKNVTFVYDKTSDQSSDNTQNAQQAAPITLQCTTQTGKTFSRLVNGSVGESGDNITELAPLPQGYQITRGQDTSYQFAAHPQNIKLSIIGKPVKGVIHLHLNEKNHGAVINSYTKTLIIHGLIGDPYKISPDKYCERGYKPAIPKAVQGTFNASGVTTPEITFDYIADHRNTLNHVTNDSTSMAQTVSDISSTQMSTVSQNTSMAKSCSLTMDTLVKSMPKYTEDSKNVSSVAKDAKVASLIAQAMNTADTGMATNQAKKHEFEHRFQSASTQASYDCSKAAEILSSDTAKPLSAQSSTSSNESAYSEYQSLMSEAEALGDTQPQSSDDVSKEQTNQVYKDQAYGINSIQQQAPQPKLDVSTVTFIDNAVDNVMTFVHNATSYRNNVAHYVSLWHSKVQSASSSNQDDMAQNRLGHYNEQLNHLNTSAHDLYANLRHLMSSMTDQNTYLSTGFVKPKKQIYKILDESTTKVTNIAQQLSVLVKRAKKVYNTGISYLNKPKPKNLTMAYLTMYTKNLHRTVNTLMGDIHKAVGDHDKDPHTASLANKAAFHASQVMTDINQIPVFISQKQIHKAVSLVQSVSTTLVKIRQEAHSILTYQYQKMSRLYQRSHTKLQSSQALIKVLKSQSGLQRNVGIQAARDRDWFVRGGQDAKKHGKPILKNEKGDVSAYAAGYRAYSNGYYDAAGNLTYYADRYQGLAEQTYAAGFASGERYYKQTEKFTNQASIEPNIKKHEKFIQIANDNGGNSDVLPYLNNSDKNHAELRLMAAILGIVLKDVATYDQRHHIEYYNDHLD